MLESIDPWIGAGAGAVLCLTALYRLYILPGYRADMAARHARDTGQVAP